MAGRDDATAVVIGELKKLYKAKIQPVEDAYLFEQFQGPPMTDAEFDARPQVLMIGQYSTGKTSFIKRFTSGGRFSETDGRATIAAEMVSSQVHSHISMTLIEQWRSTAPTRRWSDDSVNIESIPSKASHVSAACVTLSGVFSVATVASPVVWSWRRSRARCSWRDY